MSPCQIIFINRKQNYTQGILIGINYSWKYESFEFDDKLVTLLSYNIFQYSLKHIINSENYSKLLVLK